MACTAACSTATFNAIWTSLAFGYRPFWGVDVGCDRINLPFLVRALDNSTNPVLDALNILPSNIPLDAPPTIIPKRLFYFEAFNECNTAMETIRKMLPPALRGLVEILSLSRQKQRRRYCGMAFGIVSLESCVRLTQLE